MLQLLQMGVSRDLIQQHLQAQDRLEIARQLADENTAPDAALKETLSRRYPEMSPQAIDAAVREYKEGRLTLRQAVARMEAETTEHLPRSLELSRRTFAEFIRLFGFEERAPGRGSGHGKRA